jgi:tripartite-type tricarboxylate transporter receptor subunit TctC
MRPRFPGSPTAACPRPLHPRESASPADLGPPPSGDGRRRLLAAALASTAASLGGGLVRPANAQSDYPNRPVRLVVGYPPGGSGDFVSRVAADELTKQLGVSVVVENRPGAGGTIANDFVAKAAPDGYTILNAGPHALTGALYPRLPYDGEKDFIPVTTLAVAPMIILVNNDVPAQSLKELIALAKAKPGALNVASSGNGSTPHLAAALFESVAGVRFTTIQFKGGAPAAASTIAGDTQIMFSTPPTVMGFIKNGRLRPLAVTQPKASPAIPGIPGAGEAGLPGYESTFSFALYLPSGTPRPVVERLHGAAAKGMQAAGVAEKVASQGMDVFTDSSPAAFADRLRREAPQLRQLVKDSGARLE